MSKTVDIRLSDKPSECFIKIDGIPIDNVTSINASVNITDGPACTFILAKANFDECIVVPFNPVVG